MFFYLEEREAINALCEKFSRMDLFIRSAGESDERLVKSMYLDGSDAYTHVTEGDEFLRWEMVSFDTGSVSLIDVDENGRDTTVLKFNHEHLFYIWEESNYAHYNKMNPDDMATREEFMEIEGDKTVLTQFGPVEIINAVCSGFTKVDLYGRAKESDEICRIKSYCHTDKTAYENLEMAIVYFDSFPENYSEGFLRVSYKYEECEYVPFYCTVNGMKNLQSVWNDLKSQTEGIENGKS